MRSQAGFVSTSAPVQHPREVSVTPSGLRAASPGSLATTQPCWLTSSMLIYREEGYLASLSERYRAVEALQKHQQTTGSSKVCSRQLQCQLLFSTALSHTQTAHFAPAGHASADLLVLPRKVDLFPNLTAAKSMGRAFTWGFTTSFCEARAGFSH